MQGIAGDRYDPSTHCVCFKMCFNEMCKCIVIFSVHWCRFLMKSSTFGFLTMEGLCWQFSMQWHRFDTCGRCSLSSEKHAGGRNCRSSNGKLPRCNFLSGGWWRDIWLHLMLWNADGPSLWDYCISTVASELSFPTEKSALQLCTLGWIWSFECFYVNEKWEWWKYESQNALISPSHC